MIDRTRAVNVAAGFAFLAFAGMVAAYVFTIHERLYAAGVFAIGLLAISFLFLLGLSYSLIFQMNGRRDGL